MKEIIIDVSDDGDIRIETRGFSGKACLGETQFLKDLLGKETHNQLTPAYYMGKQKKKKYLQLCG
ncbi:MAG: DUF2997 domain-containing protein [Smithellaceae bacterium]